MEYNYILPKGTFLHGKTYVYRIEQVLGQGSFGVTYLASIKMQGQLGSIDTNVKVAIKEFFMKEINGREGSVVTSSSKQGLFAEYRKKFVREAINLSKLKHPNIIKVLECFEENNTVYYAMEYLSGGDLDTLIEKKGRLSVTETVLFTNQIGSALSFMHQNKMLHLDLKPKNVMLDAYGKAVLIDFGLSKQYDTSGEPESSTTVGRGTPGYAPLEQANYQDGHGFPVTMDVYALGATMYKMLSGKRAPEASVILNDGFPKDVFKDIRSSKTLVDCIVKAMSPLKKNRFSSVEELLQALNAKGTFDEEEEEKTTIDSADSEKTEHQSSEVKKILENMIAAEQYRDAYNMCLATIKRDENNEYALKKIDELVPLLKEQSKKDKRKHWFVAIIISIIGFILTVIVAILQS